MILSERFKLLSIRFNSRDALTGTMSEIVVKLPPGLDEKLLRKKLQKLIESEILMKELYGILKTKETWEELEGETYDQASAY